MVSCNVEIIGYAEKSEEMREKVNDFLLLGGNEHNSVTTIVNADVKCAEHRGKDEPFLRLYFDGGPDAEKVARALCHSLDQAVEFVHLAGSFLPE